jgi:hypothetical protein
VINRSVERQGEAMARKVNGKGEALEPLADQGQCVEFSLAKWYRGSEWGLFGRRAGGLCNPPIYPRRLFREDQK